jgi:hypothetical protein
MIAGRQRKLERAMHLLTGAVLLGYFYLPTGQRLGDIVRFLVFPLLTATGMAMWQAPRLRRLMKAARRRLRRPDLPHAETTPRLAGRR